MYLVSCKNTLPQRICSHHIPKGNDLLAALLLLRNYKYASAATWACNSCTETGHMVTLSPLIVKYHLFNIF